MDRALTSILALSMFGILNKQDLIKKKIDGARWIKIQEILVKSKRTG